MAMASTKQASDRYTTSCTPLAGKLINSIPPTHVATMMDKLKTLD